MPRDAPCSSSRSRGCVTFRRCTSCLLLVALLRHVSQDQTFAAPGRNAGTRTSSALLERSHQLVHSGRTRMTRAVCRSSTDESEAKEMPQEVKLSSVTQSTVNLVKNIVGAGMLSLPHGVAAVSASPQAVAPSLILTFLAAVFSAYGFVLIAQACEATGESTYTRVWARSVSESTKLLPAVACLAKAAIGCIAFSMILGDCISLMLAPLNLPAVIASRDAVILLMTIVVLYPLCSMKSFAPLAKFSLLGVLSNFYICAFVVLRCLDHSYQKGGSLLAAAPAAPQFAAPAGAWHTVLSPGLSVLLSILATAFLAHYNAPLFLEQLAPDPKTGKKDKRFVVVSVLGFCTAGLIFSLVMVGGFLTFGSSCMGLILNNYAAIDSLALLARAAIVLSLVTAYPLVFLSLRKQVLEILGSKGADFANQRPRAMTISLLAGVTAVAFKCGSQETHQVHDGLHSEHLHDPAREFRCSVAHTCLCEVTTHHLT
ncbi:SLC38A11 [Symbiodinium sp. CCMP2592]|nr:SLC38A11 [Symbiodinium sp. CCMP2592]